MAIQKPGNYVKEQSFLFQNLKTERKSFGLSLSQLQMFHFYTLVLFLF